MLTDWMKTRFAEEGAALTDVYFCPYHAEHGVGEYKKGSFDRKPNPGMFLRAAERYYIDVNQSIMIGDKESDMEAAKRAGVASRWFLVDAMRSVNASDGAEHIISSLEEAIEKLGD